MVGNRKNILIFILTSLVLSVIANEVNLPLFHVVVELINIFIGFMIFIAAINSKVFSERNVLLSIGVAYLFVGVLDFMYLISYLDAGIIENTINMAESYWMAARLLEAANILIIFYLYSKKYKTRFKLTFISHIFIVLLIILMISNDIGVKLTDTNFGIALELMLQIVIELAYLAGLFFALRLNFPKEQKQIIAVGLLLKIASGMVYMISFSSPNSVSVIGLMFKFYSFFAFYLVFVMVTLRTPYNNVFRLFEKRENDLLELSKIDSLTGIYNHSAILKKIEHLVAKYEETDTIFFVSMLDIDDFKMVNDLYGHQKGDIILTEFAASLMASEYPDKVVGRYGGDEFIIAGVIENDFNTDERFRIFKNRILEVCTKTGIDFTFSAGTAIYNKGDQAKDLIYKADIKMYESKRSGKNRVTVWK